MVNFIVNTHTGLHILNKLVIVLFHYNVSLYELPSEKYLLLFLFFIIIQTYTDKKKCSNNVKTLLGT